MSTSDTITFYHNPQSRAATVRWMLEELGAPFTVEALHLQKGEHKKPDYLAVNPMGKVPAIRHKGVIITETAAICCYLADEYPEARLTPAIGDPQRGPYLRWMFFAPSCIEPAVWDKALQRAPGRPGMIGYGDFDTVMNVAARAVADGPYVLGERFSAADVVFGSMILWGMMFKMLPDRPEFAAYSARLMARPAHQRARAADAELSAALELRG
jgi:glutathione S-transferase